MALGLLVRLGPYGREGPSFQARGVRVGGPLAYLDVLEVGGLSWEVHGASCPGGPSVHLDPLGVGAHGGPLDRWVPSWVAGPCRDEGAQT